MGFAADHFVEHSLSSAFGNGGHRFPLNHQIYDLYYSYFFTALRAGRFHDALGAWDSAVELAPAAPMRQAMAPVAGYVRQQLLQNGCAACAATLRRPLDAVTENNGREVSLCSSTSGNYDSLDHSLKDLVSHVHSQY